jgi:hypothetical protein
MRPNPELPTVTEVDVTTHGRLPGFDTYARDKIGGLIQRTHQPVLHAHVRVRKHTDPPWSAPLSFCTGIATATTD